MLRRVGLQRVPPAVEALRARLDERGVRQPLVEDDVGHGVEDGHVRAGVLAQPEVRVVAHLDALRVEHDDLDAVFVNGAPDAAGDDRVIR